jgi:hypothetical protein
LPPRCVALEVNAPPTFPCKAPLIPRFADCDSRTGSQSVLADHVHRNTPMGRPVLINESWYHTTCPPVPKSCPSPTAYGRSGSVRQLRSRPCHVRVFYLSTEPALGWPTLAKSIICMSRSGTEIAQKVPIQGERDNAGTTLQSGRGRATEPPAQRLFNLQPPGQRCGPP